MLATPPRGWHRWMLDTLRLRLTSVTRCSGRRRRPGARVCGSGAIAYRRSGRFSWAQHADRAAFAKIDTTSLSCSSGCSSEPSIPVPESTSIPS